MVMAAMLTRIGSMKIVPMERRAHVYMHVHARAHAHVCMHVYARHGAGKEASTEKEAQGRAAWEGSVGGGLAAMHCAMHVAMRLKCKTNQTFLFRLGRWTRVSESVYPFECNAHITT